MGLPFTEVAQTPFIKVLTSSELSNEYVTFAPSWIFVEILFLKIFG